MHIYHYTDYTYIYIYMTKKKGVIILDMNLMVKGHIIKGIIILYIHVDGKGSSIYAMF